jgi:hypothetical protein
MNSYIDAECHLRPNGTVGAAIKRLLHKALPGGTTDGNPRSIRASPGTARLASADESEVERDDEQDERDPEDPRAFHRRAGDAAEAKQRRDDGDDEEDNRPVQEISEIHDLNSVVST